jgi:hypothetical protein
MAEEHGTNVRLVKPNVRKIMRPYMNIGVYHSGGAILWQE